MLVWPQLTRHRFHHCSKRLHNETTRWRFSLVGVTCSAGPSTGLGLSSIERKVWQSCTLFHLFQGSLSKQSICNPKILQVMNLLSSKYVGPLLLSFRAFSCGFSSSSYCRPRDRSRPHLSCRSCPGRGAGWVGGAHRSQISNPTRTVNSLCWQDARQAWNMSKANTAGKPQPWCKHPTATAKGSSGQLRRCLQNGQVAAIDGSLLDFLKKGAILMLAGRGTSWQNGSDKLLAFNLRHLHLFPAYFSRVRRPQLASGSISGWGHNSSRSCRTKVTQQFSISRSAVWLYNCVWTRRGHFCAPKPFT